MTISDETLMAFADGELDGVAQEAVESAMRDDPELERRVTLHRALRTRLQEAFGAELSEPVPERLIMAARNMSAPAPVVDLREFREATLARRPARVATLPWRQVGSLAASLALGVGLSFLIWRGGATSWLRETRGSVVADGHLAAVLTNRLAGDRDSDAVVVGVSFMAKSGEYCRTFSTSGDRPAAGLACRSGGDWRIQALLQPPVAVAGDGGYRTASSSLPPQILSLVDAQIAGEPLDARGEAAAKKKNWQAH